MEKESRKDMRTQAEQSFFSAQKKEKNNIKYYVVGRMKRVLFVIIDDNKKNDNINSGRTENLKYFLFSVRYVLLYMRTLVQESTRSKHLISSLILLLLLLMLTI